MFDLNVAEGNSIFDQSVVMKANDVRQYVFWLKPVSEQQKVDNTQDMPLGNLEVQWRNYFGDAGSARYETWSALKSNLQRELDLQTVQPTVLRMEQSQLIKFRLYNLGKVPVNISISLREGLYSDQCLITNVEPSNPGQIDPLKFCDI